MRSDIKLKMYKNEYKKVNDLYCNKFLTIKDACEKIGISPKKYNVICKELGKPSVAQEKTKKQNGGENVNTDTILDQTTEINNVEPTIF